jgi:hypothetical protein
MRPIADAEQNGRSHINIADNRAIVSGRSDYF